MQRRRSHLLAQDGCHSQVLGQARARSQASPPGLKLPLCQGWPEAGLGGGAGTPARRAVPPACPWSCWPASLALDHLWLGVEAAPTRCHWLHGRERDCGAQICCALLGGRADAQELRPHLWMPGAVSPGCRAVVGSVHLLSVPRWEALALHLISSLAVGRCVLFLT